MTHNRRWIAASIAVVLLTATARPADAQQPAGKLKEPEGKPTTKPTFTPGQETRVELPVSKSFCVVYVPEDYVSGRRWPVVFNYHARYMADTWQFARTSPIKEITQGKGFIIVGMNYATKEFYASPHKGPVDREILAFKEAAGIVAKGLDISPRMIFMGGWGMGALATSVTGERMLGNLAGLVYLSGGRIYQKGGNPPPPDLVRGKPVYIGVGSKDINMLPTAKDADFEYRKMGARVTFDIWLNVGMRVDARKTKLHQWLMDAGPRRFLASDLAAVRKLERAGKLGKAYVLYKSLGDISKTDRNAITAARNAEGLAKRAKGQLAAADKAMADSDHAKAVGILSVVTREFEGTDFGDQAAKKLKALKDDPAIEAAMKEKAANTKATVLEGQAQRAEKDKDYAKAIAIYEQYVRSCEGADRYQEVVEHLGELKKDTAVQDAMGKQKTEKFCRRHLRLADNYTRAGLTEKAMACLEKVIDTYPDTPWAAEARKRLKQLQSEADAKDKKDG